MCKTNGPYFQTTILEKIVLKRLPLFIHKLAKVFLWLYLKFTSVILSEGAAYFYAHALAHDLYVCR